MHEKWTEKEVKILKRNYKKKPLKEIQEMLPNRCDSGIRMKARRLKLNKSS